MDMNKSFKPFFVLLFSLFMAITFAPEAGAETSPSGLVESCRAFETLNTGIRDGIIGKPEAKRRFKVVIKAIRNAYYASGGSDYSSSAWVFPLKGYDSRAIGGINGNGYQRGGYDYFDGNRHTGHPSEDIFIHDKHQAGVDDRTNLPVSVVAITGGVVVAVEKSWDPTSSLRGGKYIWIYDPASNALLYYAHNSRVLVETGAIVKPGDIIAEVGRTGLNAYKKRSPSHLHVTYLAIVHDLPVPRNVFGKLRGAQLI